jgi:hypothetical protein
VEITKTVQIRGHDGCVTKTRLGLGLDILQAAARLIET